MVAPTAPADLVRTGTADSNTVTVGWTDGGTTEAPYGTIEVEHTFSENVWELGFTSIDGEAITHTIIPSPTAGQRVWVRVRARNAAGASAWSTIGPLYTKANNPSSLSFANDKNLLTFSFETVTPFWEEGVTVESASAELWHAGEYSAWYDFTDDLVLTSSTLTDGTMVRVYTITDAEFVSPNLYQFRAKSTVSAPAERVRTSEWVESEQLFMSFPPETPVITYDQETLDLTIEVAEDPHPSGANARQIVFYVDGESYWQDLNDSGEARTISFSNFAPSSIFEYSVGVLIDFNVPETLPLGSSVELRTTPVSVDFDETQIMIGSTRYIASTISPAGVVTPVGVKLIERA
jgi:hypothetical protein